MTLPLKKICLPTDVPNLDLTETIHFFNDLMLKIILCPGTP